MQTALATFDDSQAARSAVDQLIAQGFSRTSVHLQSGASTSSTTATPASGGMMAGVGHLFSNLFG